LDGVRALVLDGIVLSRSLKPIPNKFVQRMFGISAFEGFDGELMVGPSNAPDVFRQTTSGVMSPDGEPDVKFHVFDLHDMPNTPFHERVQLVARRCDQWARVCSVPQTTVRTFADIELLFQDALDRGFEGLVLRNPFGLYKFGRSTVKEAGLLKMKPFADAEAVVLNMVELMHNENEAFTNELGRTARSYSKAGKVPGGVLGALVCRTPEGIEFEIGTGFSADERLQLWHKRSAFIGRSVKYKSLTIGVKDKPRHAVFLGFRDGRDQ
jgi:DNA ligase-1